MHVLLSAEKSGFEITKIAVADLKAEVVTEWHVYEDIQKGFM